MDTFGCVSCLLDNFIWSYIMLTNVPYKYVGRSNCVCKRSTFSRLLLYKSTVISMVSLGIGTRKTFSNDLLVVLPHHMTAILETG